MISRTVTIEKARKLATDTGLASLAARVEKAEQDGWNVVTLQAVPDGDGGWDIGVTEPTGAMVAIMLPDYIADQVAVPGGEAADDLHITLAYLGNAADLSLEDQRKLVGVVGEVCLNQPELRGQLTGTGRFSNGEDTDPFWVGVDIPGLTELRAKLVTALTDAGFTLPPSPGTSYTPHVTVNYIPSDAPTPPLDFNPINLCAEALTVCIGANRFELGLQEEPDDYAMPAPSGWAPTVMTKAIETVAEDRFTLGPWYIPGRLDAHNEWSDARELEKAFHSYLAKDDRSIRLQHNRDIVAGRWVSGMVVPTPYTVPMTKADGSSEEVTYPPGTPFLGVEWQPWAWELIKAGKLRGYSIGGTSERMLVDLPAQ